jgi:hypothetical protein
MKRCLVPDIDSNVDQEQMLRPTPSSRRARAAAAAAAQHAGLLTVVETLDKAVLVELVMKLAERKDMRARVMRFLEDAAASGTGPALPDDMVAAAFEEELGAAVAQVHKEAEARCCGKAHLIDEGSGTVAVVARFVGERVVCVAPGTLQLTMLLAARKAIGNFDLEGASGGQSLLIYALPACRAASEHRAGLARKWKHSPALTACQVCTSVRLAIPNLRRTPLAPSASLDLNAYTSRPPTSAGKNYDVNILGSNTLTRMDGMACACVAALAERRSEAAVRALLTDVAECFTTDSLKRYQDYGCFTRVKAMGAGGCAAALIA